MYKISFSLIIDEKGWAWMVLFQGSLNVGIGNAIMKWCVGVNGNGQCNIRAKTNSYTPSYTS